MLGQALGLSAVLGSVADGVHQDRVELMQGNPAAPVLIQFGGLRVSGLDSAQERQPEEVEHGQIGFAVTAVRGRVDEDRLVGRPQHVARPEVAVDPRGRPSVVELPGGQSRADPIHRLGSRGAEVAHVARRTAVRPDPGLGVELSPRAEMTEWQCLSTDPGSARPVRRPSPKAFGSPLVHHREGPPESFRDRGSSTAGWNTLQLDTAVGDGAHASDPRAAGGLRLGQPAQPGRLCGEEPGRSVGPLLAVDLGLGHEIGRYREAVPHVLSVNIGQAEPTEFSDVGTTGIDKRPVDGPVRLAAPGPRGAAGSGVAGDHISDLRHHGGDHQAVYMYAREDLDWWGHELGRELPHGSFGENLTTQGVDVSQALIGEVWAIGDARLELADPRIPCRTFAGWLEEKGWVKKFTLVARPGIYLRVLEPGEVRAGDDVRVVHRPAHSVTVERAFRGLTTEPALLPDLLSATALAPATLAAVAHRVGRARVTTV